MTFPAPAETAANLGIEDPAIQRAFADFFGAYFWTESSFDHDRPIDSSRWGSKRRATRS